MERASKILLIVGLVMLLAAPVVAFDGRPTKPSGWTGVAPVIDTVYEEAWENAHVEDITFGLDAGASVDLEPVTLWMMNDAGHLYLALVDPRGAVGVGEVEAQVDGLMSLFWVIFEDDPPPWEWNATEWPPSRMPDEGWFWILGRFSDNFDGLEAQTLDTESVPIFIGRVGGDQASFEHCFGGLEVPADGVESAFGFGLPDMAGGGFGSGTHIHEVAIDLEDSALDAAPGTCFRGAFVALDLTGLGLTQEELLERAELGPTLGLIDAANATPLHGLWPEDLLNCFGAPGAQNDGVDCDLCIFWHGEICLAGPPEPFVPEASTMILFGSGLASLAGYASLRLRARRKRE